MPKTALSTSLTRTSRSARPKGAPAGGKLRLRTVVIFSGAVFKVPQGLQRIDSKSTHGWQVRCHGTKMFSDHSNDGSGARASFAAATRELFARMAEHPAPTRLQRAPSHSKTSALPPGISGPIVRMRADRGTRTATLSVLLPRFGDKPRVASVYIGSESTYTPARYRAALKKALVLRAEAVAAYEAAEAQARRRAARELKAALAA
jgi:hypothetical protein